MFMQRVIIAQIYSEEFVGINFHNLLLNINKGRLFKICNFLDIRSASGLVGLNISSQFFATLPTFQGQSLEVDSTAKISNPYNQVP